MFLFWFFLQSHDALYPPAPPTNLTFTVANQTNLNRLNEGVKGGVPLPRDLNITDTNNLAVVDDSDTAVPAAFHVLARWDADINDTAEPIQWLLVIFSTSLNPNQTRTFRLITNGSVVNPTPVSPLNVTTNAGATTINTGVASFTLGPGTDLFANIQANGQTLATGSNSDITLFEPGDTNLQTFNLQSMDDLEIERQDALHTVIKVKLNYAVGNRGDSPSGSLTLLRRYTFFAGSAFVRIRHVTQWEGSYCDLQGEWPYYACDWDGSQYGTINGQHLTGIGSELSLNFSPTSINVRASAAQTSQTVGFSSQEVEVMQNLKADRFVARTFDATVPGGSNQTGESADRSFIGLHGATQSLGIAMDHMQYYEPQSIQILSSGNPRWNILAGDTWLGPRQGLFAHLGLWVGTHAGTPPNAAQMEANTWAALNHPLRPWPSPTWFAASNAVDPLPWSTLDGGLMTYDSLIPRVLENTRDNINYKGIHGITTFGSVPRYWTDPVRTDELDCGDPTPGYDWDNKYWCGAWTDYHNTFATAPMWAMRSGEIEWLDELSFPGALRQLYTQVMRCSDGDPWFYCGQAPAGYQAYRGDFNSSHAYMQNLITYYWLTGDTCVLDTLHPGAISMRDYLCPFGSPCGPEDVNTDIWATISGRSAMQWASLFRMLGLAFDNSLLNDWRANINRQFTQFYVQQTMVDDNQTYGFLLDGQQGAWPYWCPPWRDPNNPGENPNRVYWTDQLWMASLYDFPNLYRFRQDSNDQSVGLPAVLPSVVLEAWGRTLYRFGGDSLGAGQDPNGDWPNVLELLYDETQRIGATLTDPCSTAHQADNAICINRNPNTAPTLAAQDPTAACVTAGLGGGDPLLYDTGKAILASSFVKAGLLAEDPVLIETGRTFTQYALDNAWLYATEVGGNQTIGSPFGMAMGKILGEYLTHIHSAVALLAAYDAGLIPCAYPNVTGGSQIDCTDFFFMVNAWDSAIVPPMTDMNGNGNVDIAELVAIATCTTCP